MPRGASRSGSFVLTPPAGFVLDDQPQQFATQLCLFAGLGLEIRGVGFRHALSSGDRSTAFKFAPLAWETADRHDIGLADVSVRRAVRFRPTGSASVETDSPPDRPPCRELRPARRARRRRLLGLSAAGAGTRDLQHGGSWGGALELNRRGEQPGGLTTKHRTFAHVSSIRLTGRRQALPRPQSPPANPPGPTPAVRKERGRRQLQVSTARRISLVVAAATNCPPRGPEPRRRPEAPALGILGHVGVDHDLRGDSAGVLPASNVTGITCTALASWLEAGS